MVSNYFFKLVVALSRLASFVIKRGMSGSFLYFLTLMYSKLLRHSKKVGETVFLLQYSCYFVTVIQNDNSYLYVFEIAVVIYWKTF